MQSCTHCMWRSTTALWVFVQILLWETQHLFSIKILLKIRHLICCEFRVHWTVLRSPPKGLLYAPRVKAKHAEALKFYASLLRNSLPGNVSSASTSSSFKSTLNPFYSFLPLAAIKLNFGLFIYYVQHCSLTAGYI